MKKMTFPIGRNCSIDGGPFDGYVGYEASGNPPDGVHGSHQDGAAAVFTLEEIEKYVSGEMLANEPVIIDSGDVAASDGGGIVGTVRLPLMAGFMVEVHGSQDVWPLPNLTQYQRRTAVERSLKNNGGTVSPTSSG
jgi:hypothetical protein